MDWILKWCMVDAWHGWACILFVVAESEPSGYHSFCGAPYVDTHVALLMAF